MVWNFEEEKNGLTAGIDTALRRVSIGIGVLCLVVTFIAVMTLFAGFMPQYGPVF